MFDEMHFTLRELKLTRASVNGSVMSNDIFSQCPIVKPITFELHIRWVFSFFIFQNLCIIFLFLPLSPTKSIFRLFVFRVLILEFVFKKVSCSFRYYKFLNRVLLSSPTMSIFVDLTESNFPVNQFLLVKKNFLTFQDATWAAPRWRMTLQRFPYPVLCIESRLRSAKATTASWWQFSQRTLAKRALSKRWRLPAQVKPTTVLLWRFRWRQSTTEVDQVWLRRAHFLKPWKVRRGIPKWRRLSSASSWEGCRWHMF